jgi:2-amino-4-hydroxy-6-hydroxymethyldihydropteridine diphosphokinase
MSDTPVCAWVGLGANLGDTAAALRAAFVALDHLPRTRLEKVSSFYRSTPVDASGPDYLNAVAVLSTSLSPQDLLSALHGIELAQGRERLYHHAPRTLDLDLLLYGEASITTPALTVPHPRLHERAFVLVPLAEVAPAGLLIPGRGALPPLLAKVLHQPLQKLESP